MGTVNCCTSRRPPSPDGAAPRPVLMSEIPLQGEVAPTYLDSSNTSSRLSRPEDVAELQAIFESDKSSFESKCERIKRSESSNTLKSVTTKLRKHLSRDSGVSKRYSRASVGTSEEEIERRAELRRIRHKRIQEELSCEGIYDEDAQSLRSVIVACSDNQRNSCPSLTSPARPPLELPQLELPSLDLPELFLPQVQHMNSWSE